MLSSVDKKSPEPRDAAGDEYLLSASSEQMNISKYKHHLAQYSPGPQGCQRGVRPALLRSPSFLFSWIVSAMR